MPRAMWKGAIQFGLVTIPVKLFLATESKGISFNMLHAPDLSRIQMKIWCPQDEKVIDRSETVRGYEWSKGQYVVVTDEDLEAVPLKTVRSIEIEQFVSAEHEDGAVRFVKQAYYLEPEPIGRKAFYLLKAVLAEKDLTAICKVVIKDREALSALDPFGKTMLLTTLHWPDEIRSTGELELPEDEFTFKPAERAMAEQLVTAMTGEFDPANYRDEYREALMRVIEAKVEGRETVEVEKPTPSGIVDLMAALEASVAKARETREAGAPTEVAARRKGAAPRGEEAGAGAEERPAASKRARPKVVPAKKAEEEAEEAAEARPARRRKSA